MIYSKMLLCSAGLACLAALGAPAVASDFSISFGFSSGAYYYGDCGPQTYVYYDSAPRAYRRDCGRSVVVYDYAPTVRYRDCRPQTTVYRRTPAVYYRDCTPRRTVVYRSSSPRYYRSTKTYYSRSYDRSYPRSHDRYSPSVYQRSFRAHRWPGVTGRYLYRSPSSRDTVRWRR